MRTVPDRLLSFVESLAMTLGVLGLLLAPLPAEAQYNVLTGQEETLWISPEKEKAVGRKAADALEKHFKMVTDQNLLDRLDRIGSRLAAVSGRKDVTYFFKIIDEDEINATSLPGGYIYVQKGVFNHVDSDDELASILAHEIVHVAARHSIKRMQAGQGYNLLMLAAIFGARDARVAQGANLAFMQAFLAHAREDEFLADRVGIQYLKKAGFDPNAMVTFLEKLQKENKKDIRPFFYGRTHPYVAERIAKAREEVKGRMDFESYINTVGEEPY